MGVTVMLLMQHNYLHSTNTLLEFYCASPYLMLKESQMCIFPHLVFVATFFVYYNISTYIPTN